MVQLVLAALLIMVIVLYTWLVHAVGITIIAAASAALWIFLFARPALRGVHTVGIFDDELVAGHLIGRSRLSWGQVSELRTSENTLWGTRTRLVGIVSQGRAVLWLSDRILGFDEMLNQIRAHLPRTCLLSRWNP